MNNYYAVIMAGGVGSRFWPISTSQHPKQFQDMLGTGNSLLQTTYSRINKLISEEHTYILTNDRYNALVKEHLPLLTDTQIVLEPAMRNTAPCILLAALKIYKENPNALMLVAPSDHWIENEEAFLNDVETCFNACETEDRLMTLGITPTFPNTGYGYIEYDKNDSGTIKSVNQFREKPDYDTAKHFLEEGNFLWNAGIFIWSVKSIIASYKNNLPIMHDLFSEGIENLNTIEERSFIESHYAQAENISIDYGILEKSNNVFVKQASFDWNDLGTWGALYDKLDKDSNNNAVVRAKTYSDNSSNNMVYTSKEKLVVLEDLEDYIVVDKEDVLMIYPKKKDQDIKNLVSNINQNFGDKLK